MGSLLGTTKWITGTWKDKDDNLVDVTTLSILVEDSEGTDQTPGGGITPTWVSTGVYIADFLIDATGDIGTWVVTWTVTLAGDMGAAKLEFEVEG